MSTTATLTLLMLLLCSASVYSAPVSNDVADDFSPERECVYQLKRYAHASIVETEEPCLNCTCNRGVLVCFLRVCHNLVAPPNSACSVVKLPGKCCSELVCGVETDEVKEREETPAKPTNVTESVTENGESPSAVKSGSSAEEQQQTTTDRYVADDDDGQWSSSLSPTTLAHDSDELFQSGCSHNGSVFAEGSAMPSDNFCEYCYCIRGHHRCIRPQCHLHIDDCQPIYRQDFSCCPTAYKCSKHPPEAAPSTTTVAPPHKGCNVNGTLYKEGVAVINDDVCQNCFCVNGNVKCSVTRCAIQLNGCRPIVQPGKCCPTGYNCSYVNIIEDSEPSTTEDLSQDETAAVESRKSLENGKPHNETLQNQSKNEAITTENVDENEEVTTTDLPNELSFSSTSADELPTEAADVSNDSWTTDSNVIADERSDDHISTEYSTEYSTEDILQGRFDATTEFGIESDVNVTEISSNDSDNYQSTVEPEVSSDLPEFQEESNIIEKTANISIDDVTTEFDLLQSKDDNLTEEYEKPSSTNITQHDITYRTSSGNVNNTELHNKTAELVQHVAEQLLSDHKVAFEKPVDNFSNWTHVDNETDLLQTSNSDLPVIQTNSTESESLNKTEPSALPADPSSANLHGSLHSIVNSLLAKPEITTEGSNNYSILFEDLIGEGPGEFHFNPINYFNFSDAELKEAATPSSYRQEFYPTSPKLNEIPELVTIKSANDGLEVVKNVTLADDSEVESANNLTEVLDIQLNDTHKTNAESDADYQSKFSSIHTNSSIVIDTNSSQIASDFLINNTNLSQIASDFLINNTNLSQIASDSLINTTNSSSIEAFPYSELPFSNETLDNNFNNESLIITKDEAENLTNNQTIIDHEIKPDHLNDTFTNASFDVQSINTSSSDVHDQIQSTTPLIQLFEFTPVAPDETENVWPTTETVLQTTKTLEEKTAIENNDTIVIPNQSDSEKNDSVTHFYAENEPNNAETTPSAAQFSDSDLEDTIEMILNLSKTFAATNKRPTQYRPSENSSATDLLSGTLPADVEAKLTEIIRMAQAGLIPTEEPSIYRQQSPLNISFNFENLTPAPAEEGDEYYNDYYDDDAKEAAPPSLSGGGDPPTKAATSESKLPAPEKHDNILIKELQHVLQPLLNISTHLSSAENSPNVQEPLLNASETTPSPNVNQPNAFHDTTTVAKPHISEVTSDFTDSEHVGHSEVVEEDVNSHKTNTEPISSASSIAENSRTEPVAAASIDADHLSERFDAAQQDGELYDSPVADDQSFQGNEDFPQGMSESVAAELDDQISAGSSVHQEEQPIGGEAGAVFEEPLEEHIADQQPEDESQFDGIAGAGNDEEKSYFSSHDNYDSKTSNQREDVFESESQSADVFESVPPLENPEQVDIHKPDSTTASDVLHSDNLPAIHPELVKDFIENVKFESRLEPKETTRHQTTLPDTTTSQSHVDSTSAAPTTPPISNKLIDHHESVNFFEKADVQPVDEHSPVSITTPFPELPLKTEAVISDTSRPFVGLVKKGSIVFDHVLPLSRRGRPTTDEKTGQALPTPRKSNSSSHDEEQSSSVSGALEFVEDTPAVIPFLPEDAITDEHLLKEPLFGGGTGNAGGEQPIIIEKSNQKSNNRSDFALHVSASTAINVHDPNAQHFDPEHDTFKGVAIPEPHIFKEEEIPAKISVTMSTTTVHDSDKNRTEDVVVTTEEPKKAVTTQTTLTASPLPKFDDYQHRESPSALGLQQTPEYCVENGEVFQDGERIPTHDFCAQCRCVRGEIQCQHLSCPQKPAGCTEKIVPSSCCPAFVCNGTENGDGAIKSGITIHSGFVPIDRPVLPSDHQPSKSSTRYPADDRLPADEIVGEISAADHLLSHPTTTPISTELGVDRSTKPPQDEGIFGSLLEAVFGHGFNDGHNNNRTLLDSIAEVEEPEITTPVAVEVTRKAAVPTTTARTTTSVASSTRKRLPSPTTTPTTKESGESMLWPMLKVSGCNIYGRVYQVGATIGVLSGPCKECKCTSTGVDCYKVKCF